MRSDTAAKAGPDSIPRLLQQGKKISWQKHNKRQVLPSLFGKNLLSGGEGGAPEEPGRCPGDPILCLSSLSLHPTRTMPNLSLRFELCHLPFPAAPSSSSLSPGLVGQRRSPSSARPRACPAGSSLASRNRGCGRRLRVTAAASTCPDVLSSPCTLFLKHPLLCGGLISPQGFPLPFPSVG